MFLHKNLKMAKIHNMHIFFIEILSSIIDKIEYLNFK